MAIPPVIETQRLKILPFGEPHLTDRYVAWLNDPEVVRFSEQRHHHHTLASCRHYWHSFLDSPNLLWAIVVHDSSLGHIGNINAYMDEKNSLTDIGIMIGEKAAWRKGYGLEAWQAVCSYLLDDAGVRKVTAGAMATNKDMLRIMNKSGMVADGRRIRQYIFNDEEVDVIFAALFKASFK